MSEQQARRGHVPEGYFTVTPWIVSRDTARLLDFVARAFQAEELGRVELENGAIGHAEFRIGDATLMASDGRCSGQARFGGVSLSLSVPDEATADRLFAALAEGRQVQMPIGKTFFSPHFGIVADRFGVSWMVITEPEA